jgi:IstB-like ATP binding protein
VTGIEPALSAWEIKFRQRRLRGHEGHERAWVPCIHRGDPLLAAHQQHGGGSRGQAGHQGFAGPGPSGTGKTFPLEALGQQAVEAGLKVAWFTLDLGVLLRRHRADDTVSKAIARVLRAELVVDDIGLLPVSQDAAEGLYRLVEAPMRNAR